MNKLSKGIIFALLRGWWITILFMAIGVGSAYYFYMQTAEDIYESTGSLYIKNYNKELEGYIGYNELLGGELIAADVKAFLQSELVLDKAADKLGDYDYTIFLDLITVKSGKSSRIVEVSFKHVSPDMAADGTNAIISSFIEISDAFFPTIEFVPIDWAGVPTSSRNNMMQTLILGAAPGIFLGMLVSLLIAFKKGKLNLELKETK